MARTIAVQVNGECQVGRGAVFVDVLRQQKRIRAQVHESLARNDPGDDLRQLLVDERLAAGDGYQRRSAFVQSTGQRTMISHGGTLGHLGDKYVTGITPGYRVVHGLGGNVKGRSDEGVNAWRADYLHARAEFGVAGFAAYQMLDRNGYRETLRPMLKAFAAGLRTEGAR